MRENEMPDLYPASINTVDGVKWGFINSKGEIRIKVKYDDASDFQNNGLSVVGVKDVYGIINTSGKYVVEPRYSSISQFSEGLSVVMGSKGFKLINESGKEITKKDYDYLGNCKDGRVLFGIIDSKGNYLYGYLDKEGKEVIPSKYESAQDFNALKAVVKIKQGEYALIGINGEQLKVYHYAFVGNLAQGLLTFRKTDRDKTGYINESGSVVIPPRYRDAQNFNQGRAVVNLSDSYTNEYGLIDMKGNFAINPVYNEIRLLGENRVTVGKVIDKENQYLGSKYSVADLNGHFFVGFIYNNVSNYNHDLASAFNNTNTFFIDIIGRGVKRLPVVDGSGTMYIKGDIIIADVDYRRLYLDGSGNLIWAQNTRIPLDNKYTVIEEKSKPNKDYLVYYPQIDGMEDKTSQENVNKKLKELSKVKEIDENMQLDYNYVANFVTEFFKKDLLVLGINGYEYHFGAAHGIPSRTYANIDLLRGVFYELKDLFEQDSSYVKMLSDIIQKQIKTNPEYSYIFPDTYKGIKEDQSFYVKEDALYIYFDPYEIAPFAAGFPTFKIPYQEIKGIINEKGNLWRSFNDGLERGKGTRNQSKKR